jgi:polar amino acid transport system substrate-binding protein
VQGRADAFIYDQLSVYKYAAKNAGETRALLRPFAEEFWAAGLALGNETLRTEVNAFLDSYRAQGGFKTLGDRYLKEEKSALESLGIPFILQ